MSKTSREKATARRTAKRTARADAELLRLLDADPDYDRRRKDVLDLPEKEFHKVVIREDWDDRDWDTPDSACVAPEEQPMHFYIKYSSRLMKYL